MTAESNLNSSDDNTEHGDPLTEFFGEPISVYTRQQAIEDGALVDVTEWHPRVRTG